MRIQRQGARGGVYASDISVHAKLTFTPLGGGRPLALSQEVHFDHREGTPWARMPGQSSRPTSNYARVDVDGDGQAETVIPGPGNFLPGYMLRNGVLVRVASTQHLQGALESASGTVSTCHCDSTASFSDDPNLVNQDPTGCQHLHCPSNPGVLVPVNGT